MRLYEKKTEGEEPRFPHTRGDAPLKAVIDAAQRPVSPYTWECTPGTAARIEVTFGSPARTGICPSTLRSTSAFPQFPCTCGDLPPPLASLHRSTNLGSPTHVGIYPPRLSLYDASGYAVLPYEWGCTRSSYTHIHMVLVFPYAREYTTKRATVRARRTVPPVRWDFPSEDDGRLPIRGVPPCTWGRTRYL